MLLQLQLKELELDVVAIQPEFQTFAFLFLACRSECCCRINVFWGLWWCSPPNQGPVQAFKEGVPLDLSGSS